MERLRHLTALQRHLTGLQSLHTEHQNLRTGLQQPLMTPQPQTATMRQSRTAMTQADESAQLNCPRKPGTSTPSSTLPTRCSTATALHNLPSTPLPRPNINLVEACRSSTRFMKGFWDPICAKTYLSPLWDP